MRKLPKGWESAKLQDLAAAEPRAITDGPFGSNLKSAHYVGSGPRVIRLQNVGFGEFIDEKAHITESHFGNLRAHEAQAGDLVVASLGQDLPRACLVPRSLGPAIVKADCIRVRLHPGIDARYVNYALQRPDLRHAVADQIHGVGRPRLGMAGVKELSIPLPPRQEQERIVAAIEEHLSHLDAAESAVLSARARLRQMGAKVKQAVLADAPLVPLADLALGSRYGTSVKCSYTASGPGVIRIPNIVDERVVVDDLKYATDPTGVSPEVLLHDGDVLFVRTNGSKDLVGRAAIASGDAIGLGFASYLIRYRLRPNVDPYYLCAVMSAPSIRSVLERLAATTAGQYNLSASKLDGIRVPLPPIEDQRRLVNARSEGVTGTTRLANDLLAVERRAAALRRSILAAAFSGRLVAQDPSDEPASVLLERIRAERAAAGTGRRRR